MLPRTVAHYLYGIIQAALTCLVTSGISTYALASKGAWAAVWMQAWVLSWCAMLPLVIGAAPLIRRLVDRIARD